jgi:hypothetical protein
MSLHIQPYWNCAVCGENETLKAFLEKIKFSGGFEGCIHYESNMTGM